MPAGYDLGINCAGTSYDGKLFFGLIADASVAPDVNRVRDFLQADFEELRVSAELKPAPRAANLGSVRNSESRIARQSQKAR